MSSKKKLRIKGDIEDVLNKHNLSSKGFSKKSKTNPNPPVIEVVKQNKEVKPILEFKRDTPKKDIIKEKENNINSSEKVNKSDQPSKINIPEENSTNKKTAHNSIPNKLSPKRSPINKSYNLVSKSKSINNDNKSIISNNSSSNKLNSNIVKEPKVQMNSPNPITNILKSPTISKSKSNNNNNNNNNKNNNLKPISIDLNYNVCGEKPKTLTKKKQREIENFFNKKFVPSNKTPDYRRKISPMSNKYKEELEKVGQNNSLRYTNRISRINELVNNRNDIKVFRNNSKQIQQNSQQGQQNNQQSQQNNQQNQQNNQQNSDSDIPESLKALKKKREFLLQQKRKEMEKLTRKKNQLRKIHQRKEEIAILKQIEQDKKELDLLRLQQLKMDQINHSEEQKFKLELERTKNQQSQQQGQQQGQQQDQQQGQQQIQQQSQQKKYNYEGIDIRKLVKKNLTKHQNKIVTNSDNNSNKKTKKRVNFDLQRNQVLKFDKNKPIINQTKELKLEDLNFNTGETFEIKSTSQVYKIYESDNPISDTCSNIISDDNILNNNIIFILNNSAGINDDKKLILQMGTNEKKRWLMKKYGFKNIRELNNKQTNLIYSILNSLDIKFIIKDK
jgi:hypothetical protein